MPIHPDYRPIASFASKAVIHPSYIPQESKAVIHPSYRPKDETTSFGSQECGAGGDSNDVVSQARRYSMGELRSDHLGAVTAGVDRDNLTDAGLGNNSAYVDEDVDGYMKFGDIKAEFAGAYSNSWRDIRDHNHGKFAGALTNSDHAFGLDVGPVNQGADVWTNDSATSFQNALHSDHNDSKRSNWDVICDIGTSIKQDGIDLQSDALVQQVNGTIGHEMQPDKFFSHNPEWFAPGSAVDAVGASNPMGIEPNQMMGSISRGDMFAPTSIVIRENAN